MTPLPNRFVAAPICPNQNFRTRLRIFRCRRHHWYPLHRGPYLLLLSPTKDVYDNYYLQDSTCTATSLYPTSSTGTCSNANQRHAEHGCSPSCISCSSVSCSGVSCSSVSCPGVSCSSVYCPRISLPSSDSYSAGVQPSFQGVIVFRGILCFSR